MTSAIRQVAVIGSGVMGSQIAAHVANAGVPVLLLDIVPKDAGDRSMLARGAIEKLLKMDPAPLMLASNAKLMTPGNLEDDLHTLKDCDWIIEAVLENPDIKRDLYRKLETVRKPGSIVSSNTSTIPLGVLTDGLPDSFAKDFLITHFFNPPRYLRLLEIVTGPKTREGAVEGVRDFADRRLGKGVVPCKDTPGFIANRLGTFFIQAAVNAALHLRLTVEEADAVCSKPMGMPKTGIFGLIDLVGLDLWPMISKNLLATLPADDGFRTIHRDPPLFQKMVTEGYTGRKGKGGFYRMNVGADGKKAKESINLQTGEYAPSKKPKLATIEQAGKNLHALCEAEDKIGRFAWEALAPTLAYAASLVPQISDTIVAVDTAMRLGFNWQQGPFELIDRLGADWLAERLAAEGKPVPPLLKTAAGKTFYRVEGGRLEYMTTDGIYLPVRRSPGVLLLSDIKRASKPVAKNGSASLWDIGEGVLCLEFHSKMNAIDPDSLAMVRKAVATISGDNAAQGGAWKGLVVHNEAENFSVGANLGLAMFAINIAMWPAIEDLVKQGQESYQALRFAPFPSVAAPSGMALGGGCEVTLHCSATQAHAETYIGLVEVGVGLIPGWGGCAQMLGRAFGVKKRFGGPIPPISRVFEMISMAKVAKSAAEAQEMMLLRPTDGITMNRDRLLYDARQRVIELARDYTPPEPWQISLPGKTGRAALNLAIEGFRLLGKALPHDVTVSHALANILCGGDGDFTSQTTEEQILALERREFLRLIQTPESIARIEHMLNTGKPLRN